MKVALTAAAFAALLATGALAQVEPGESKITMPTDSATTADGAATMDGTMAIDASPTDSTSAAAEADAANTGETGNPVPGAKPADPMVQHGTTTTN